MSLREEAKIHSLASSIRIRAKLYSKTLQIYKQEIRSKGSNGFSRHLSTAIPERQSWLNSNIRNPNRLSWLMYLKCGLGYSAAVTRLGGPYSVKCRRIFAYSWVRCAFERIKIVWNELARCQEIPSLSTLKCNLIRRVCGPWSIIGTPFDSQRITLSISSKTFV